jgi:hypothetical protein
MKGIPIFSLSGVARICLLTFTLLLLSLCVEGQTVYVTNTGTKYHTSGCHYLSKSKIAMKVDSAITQDYTACSICKPQVSSSNKKKGIAEIETMPVKSATSSQCAGLTKAGNRCSRMTKEANGRCWQHQ